MVDSDKGITNLHVPSDVIVDASMPAMIRTSGHMWNADGGEQDTLAVHPRQLLRRHLPGRLDDCRAHGAFDPATMGSVPTSASWPRRRRSTAATTRRSRSRPTARSASLDGSGTVLLEHDVSAGDIWRACQTKDVPIRDWVKLAVTRARATGTPAVFWLDADRAHDANLIAKVDRVPRRARHRRSDHRDHGARPTRSPSRWSGSARARTRSRSPATSCATTSPTSSRSSSSAPRAKMLSVVPLINGGGLFETGAGGSAPKHVQQLVKENYLRWDSLGEFLALAVSFEHLADVTDNARAQHPRPRRSTARPAPCSSRTRPRPARSARSTTAAATCSSPSTGRRSSRPRPTTPSWRRRSPTIAAGARRQRGDDLAGARRRAGPRPSTSVATTGPTPTRSTPSCAPRRPSTRSSPPSPDRPPVGSGHSTGTRSSAHFPTVGRWALDSRDVECPFSYGVAIALSPRGRRTRSRAWRRGSRHRSP